MKKLILPALFMGAIAFGSTSCKKDYTCACTFDDGSGTNTTIDLELKDVKKKDAKDACDAAGSIYILAGGTCELK